MQARFSGARQHHTRHRARQQVIGFPGNVLRRHFTGGDPAPELRLRAG